MVNTSAIFNKIADVSMKRIKPSSKTNPFGCPPSRGIATSIGKEGTPGTTVVNGLALRIVLGSRAAFRALRGTSGSLKVTSTLVMAASVSDSSRAKPPGAIDVRSVVLPCRVTVAATSSAATLKRTRKAAYAYRRVSGSAVVDTTIARVSELGCATAQANSTVARSTYPSPSRVASTLPAIAVSA